MLMGSGLVFLQYIIMVTSWNTKAVIYRHYVNGFWGIPKIGNMKRSRRASQEIAYWQPRFRLLKDWTIKFDTESSYTGQCSQNVRKKLGIIHDWGSGRMPKDYIFHEMLHFAQAVVCVSRKSREDEETLVQDISKIVFHEK